MGRDAPRHAPEGKWGELGGADGSRMWVCGTIVNASAVEVASQWLVPRVRLDRS